jgi:hypothetical protein
MLRSLISGFRRDVDEMSRFWGITQRRISRSLNFTCQRTLRVRRTEVQFRLWLVKDVEASSGLARLLYHQNLHYSVCIVSAASWYVHLLMTTSRNDAVISAASDIRLPVGTHISLN